MPKDYAEELAERWEPAFEKIFGPIGNCYFAKTARLLMIREALEKAAEVCSTSCNDTPCLHGSCAVMREARNRIRALGAKP